MPIYLFSLNEWPFFGEYLRWNETRFLVKNIGKFIARERRTVFVDTELVFSLWLRKYTEQNRITSNFMTIFGISYKSTADALTCIPYVNSVSRQAHASPCRWRSWGKSNRRQEYQSTQHVEQWSVTKQLSIMKQWNDRNIAFLSIHKW